MGVCICYDRRWPETYRVLALKGAEMVFLGYNTPDQPTDRPGVSHLANFHNMLSMQAGAYQNGMWVVGVAKAGDEEGCQLLGESSIIAPSGEIRATCVTDGDELVVAEADLDLCANYKDTLFDFGYYRRPEVYGAITGQAGVEVPADVAAALGRGGVDGEGER